MDTGLQRLGIPGDPEMARAALQGIREGFSGGRQAGKRVVVLRAPYRLDQWIPVLVFDGDPQVFLAVSDNRGRFKAVDTVRQVDSLASDYVTAFLGDLEAEWGPLGSG